MAWFSLWFPHFPHGFPTSWLVIFQAEDRADASDPFYVAFRLGEVTVEEFLEASKLDKKRGKMMDL